MDEMNTGSVLLNIEETNGETSVDIAELVDVRAPIPERTSDTLVIVGFADGHRDLAPWDIDAEFWGLNRLHAVLKDKPWSRWFEVHELEHFYAKDDQHKQWMRKANIPIYVRPQDLGVAAQWGITSATPYPVERILELFKPYFNNSISWLLALAIAMEFKTIHVYGVDMAQDSLMQAEYSQQRPSCEFFLGVAAGLGIHLLIPEGSDLLKTSALYGFADDPLTRKQLARFQELGNRKEQIKTQAGNLRAQAEHLMHQASQLDGAMQEITYQVRNLTTSPAVPATVGGSPE